MTIDDVKQIYISDETVRMLGKLPLLCLAVVGDTDRDFDQN